MRETALFVVDAKNFEKLIEKETEIAIVCGMPFDHANGILKPLTKINIDVFKGKAPNSLIQKLDQITAVAML